LAELYQATGTPPLHPSYALSHIGSKMISSLRPPDTGQSLSWHTIASYAVQRRWCNGCCGGTTASSLPSLPSPYPIITYGEASWTGLLNIHTCDYEPKLVQLLGGTTTNNIDQRRSRGGGGGADSHPWRLPQLIPTNVPIGTWDVASIQDDYYRRWPALVGAKLYGGIPDGFAATIGSKCGHCCDPTTTNHHSNDPGPPPLRIAVTMGTTAAARVVVEYPSCPPAPEEGNGFVVQTPPQLIVPPGLFAYRLDESHVLLGGALNDGGSVVEWASNLLNLGGYESDAFQHCLDEAFVILQQRYQQENDDTLSRHAASPHSIRPPRPPRNYLSMVPFLSGERSTGFRHGATGALVNLTRDTTPAHFLLSCLEGVVLRLNAIITLLRSNATIGSHSNNNNNSDERVSPPIIVISGKALETNGLWRQMLADCTGLAVVYDATTTEGTSRGVAKYISSRHDAYEWEALTITSRTDPVVAGTDYWRAAAVRQNALLDAVEPLFAVAAADGYDDDKEDG
jgi:gluconokinase